MRLTPTSKALPASASTADSSGSATTSMQHLKALESRANALECDLPPPIDGQLSENVSQDVRRRWEDRKARESQMQAQPVPPWRAHSRNRPHPPDAQPVPSVDSASIEPIVLDDSAELVEDTQNAEDAEMDDAANPSIYVSCHNCGGNSGCEMANGLWFGQQLCTLCFNMNFAMMMIKEGDLEGRYCFALDAALRSVVKKSGGEEILKALEIIVSEEEMAESDVAG